MKVELSAAKILASPNVNLFKIGSPACRRQRFGQIIAPDKKPLLSTSGFLFVF